MRTGFGVGVMLVAGALVPACARRAPEPAPPAHLMGSEAGAVVLRAIEAHGGWAAWMAARSAEYDWEWPGPTPQDPPRRARVRLDLHSGKVRIDDAGTGWVQVWDGSEAWSEPPDAPLDVPARFATRTEHYWFCVPWKLADEGARLELLDDEERDGRRFRRVKVTYGEGVGDSPQDWYIYYFSADSGLLERAVFTVTFFGPDPGQGGFTPYYGEWIDPVGAGGLKIPSRRRFGPWNEGKPAPFQHEDRLIGVRVSAQPLPEAIFQRGAS